MANSTLPLDRIQIAAPCRASWDGMPGDDRVRYCGQCEKHVYNLSGMARHDAQALVSQTEGRLCVRFYRRADDTILTQDCPVGMAALRRPIYLVAGLAAAFLFASLSLVTAGAFVLPRLRDGGEPRNPVQIVRDWFFPPIQIEMGGICPVILMPPDQAPDLPLPDLREPLEVPIDE